MSAIEKTASVGAVLRVYGRAVRKYPLWLFLMLVGILGMQASNLAVPLYLRELLNTLAKSPPEPAVVERLFTIVGILAAWLFIRWISHRGEHYFNLHIIVSVMANLVSEAFEYLIGHSYNFFISNFAGSLTYKVHKFGKSFQIIYEGITQTFLPTFLFVCGAVVILFMRHPLLGIALGVWVVLLVCFQIWVTYLRQPLRRARAQADTRMTATLADAVSNHSTIALFTGDIFEKNLFRRVVEVWKQAGLRAWKADLLIWAGMGLLMMIIEVGLFWTGVALWQQNLLTVGDFILIQAYLLILFERLNAILLDLRRAFDAFADGGEMLGIMQMSHDVEDVPGAKKLKISKREVVFGDVSFYFHTTPVLQNFNLTIAGGEKVALVGPSGAGKSTLTRLLLRLYNIKEGAILIDGQNIAEVTQESLRGAIAFVPQEPILFHRTLMDNIRYGRRDASEEEVYEAAKKAHCHEFISELPLGYETYVGERGVKLSGGERQRVAIARAILKNAPILVLDEATSSLDSESERLIQDALEVLMEGKTVIVIAHRLSTIMKMDRIVVMEKGLVVAQGSHQELLQRGGLYQKLWSIQAGGFLGSDDSAPPQPPEGVYEELLADPPEEK